MVLNLYEHFYMNLHHCIVSSLNLKHFLQWVSQSPESSARITDHGFGVSLRHFDLMKIVLEILLAKPYNAL